MKVWLNLGTIFYNNYCFPIPYMSLHLVGVVIRDKYETISADQDAVPINYTKGIPNST